MLTIEQIQKNAQTVDRLISKIENKDLIVKLQNLLKSNPEYYTAPASANTKQFRAYPGGLVEHSLAVLQNLFRLKNSFNKTNLSSDDLTLVGLFYALGKVEYFIANINEWEVKNRGMNYIYKEDILFMPTAHRSVKILHDFGIKLSEEVYLAILLAEASYTDEGRLYAFREPDLALLLQWANRWAIQEAKKLNK